jgi:hypothetical protein
MDDDNPIDHANRVADAITDRIGRVWDNDSRQRLASWLGGPERGTMAVRWLTYVGSPQEVGSDPAAEFVLRRPMYDVLAGSLSVIVNGFTSGTNGWLPRRRKAPDRQTSSSNDHHTRCNGSAHKPARCRTQGSPASAGLPRFSRGEGRALFGHSHGVVTGIAEQVCGESVEEL